MEPAVIVFNEPQTGEDTRAPTVAADTPPFREVRATTPARTERAAQRVASELIFDNAVSDVV